MITTTTNALQAAYTSARDASLQANTAYNMEAAKAKPSQKKLNALIKAVTIADKAFDSAKASLGVPDANISGAILSASDKAVDAGYLDCILATKAAVTADVNSEGKYKAAGVAIAAFYKSKAALLEVKAQFIADAIMPSLDSRHAAALVLDLPRKGGKEYAAFVAKEGEVKWIAGNEAKIAARATGNTYFQRVVSYAFPEDKAEKSPRDLKTRCNEELAALVKACQSAEAPSFDVMSFLGCLDAALKVLNK